MRAGSIAAIFAMHQDHRRGPDSRLRPPRLPWFFCDRPPPEGFASARWLESGLATTLAADRRCRGGRRHSGFATAATRIVFSPPPMGRLRRPCRPMEAQSARSRRSAGCAVADGGRHGRRGVSILL